MKKPGKILHYIVTKRGLPCALVKVLPAQRGGVLLPQPSGAQEFRRRARAKAALQRTEKMRQRLHESLIRDWLVERQTQIKELLTPGEFAVVAVRAEAKQ